MPKHKLSYKKNKIVNVIRFNCCNKNNYLIVFYRYINEHNSHFCCYCCFAVVVFVVFVVVAHCCCASVALQNDQVGFHVRTCLMYHSTTTTTLITTAI